MIIDPTTARTRLDSPSNLINKLSIPAPKAPVKVTIIEKRIQGNAEGTKRLPSFLHTQAAILTRSGAARPIDIAEELGVSGARISQIKNGESTKIDEKAVDLALGKVRDRALDKLMSSMNLMTDDKLDKCKAGELSTIAANMSRVVEKTLPRQETGPGTGAQVIIYAPQIRQETSYKTVEVG